MGTDNNAYGNFQHPVLSYKPGPGETIAAYVRSGGPSDGDPSDLAAKLVTTLNAGLNWCRPGKNDIVVVLPGHAEDISSADQMSNLQAGTQIVGLGNGNARGTFTWTAATASFLLDVANVTIRNVILEMAGDAGGTALSVAAPMTVSAAGCTLLGCRIQTAVDADERATIAITTTAAGDDFTIDDCFLHGGGDGTGVTTAVRLVGADRFLMRNTTIDASTSSTTVGVLQMLTTASTQVRIENCVFANRKALSVHAATGMAAATGHVKDCHFSILDTATLGGFETEGSLTFSGCTTSNLAGEAGGAKTPVSTV